MPAGKLPPKRHDPTPTHTSNFNHQIVNRKDLSPWRRSLTTLPSSSAIPRWSRSTNCSRTPRPPYWPSSSSTTRPRASRTVSLSRSLTRLRLPASSIREARLLKPRPVIQVSVWLWLARLAATRSSSRCPRQCRRSAAPSSVCWVPSWCSPQALTACQEPTARLPRSSRTPRCHPGQPVRQPR